jgi:hypothetical protein
VNNTRTKEYLQNGSLIFLSRIKYLVPSRLDSTCIRVMFSRIKQSICHRCPVGSSRLYSGVVLYTNKSRPVRSKYLELEFFGGWLQSYLESQMMDCQYDQANAAMSIPLAVSCYRYISDKFTLFTDIVSFRS